MAEISKITLPSGNTYDLKDAVARQMISGGVSFIVAWDGTSAPVVANIPAGVVVTYNETDYTGTLTAETSGDGEGPYAQAGAFYLVKSSTQQTGSKDVYDEYVPVGVTGSKFWEKIGDTQIDLTDVVTAVTLSKSTDTVIGSDATFTNTQPTISLAAGSTGDVTVVTDGTTKYMAATATGGGAAWNSKDQVTAVTGYASPSTDTFVKSVSAETNKSLVTTTVPNVTAAGSASTWNFAMGSGAGNTETLIISGANSTAPTLGTAITVATGATATNGSGDAVVTGVTVGDSAAAITALGTPTTDTVIGSDATFTNTQPTISLSAEGSSAAGRAEFVQQVDKSKKISGTATGGATSWNNKDSVTVLKDTTDVSVTKGTV